MTITLAKESIYDTHAAIRYLTSTGLTEPQAEAVVQLHVYLNPHNLATKTDIAAIQTDIATTQNNIGILSHKNEADIIEAKTDLLKWVMCMNVGLLFLIIIVAA